MVHHVVSRFVDRNWFIRDEEERAYYLKLVGRAVDESDWRCLAYAIMSNHLHLAMVAGESSLESWIKRVNSPFAHWMNRRWSRLGPLFASRPSVYIVRPADEANLLAYLHNNPVRAKVVAKASQSNWTSHRDYLRAGSRPSWLSVEEGLSRSGFAGEPKMFDDWVSVTIDPDFERTPLERLRREVRRRGSVELGTPYTGTPCEVPIVGRLTCYVRPDADQVLAAVAAETGVAATRIASRTVARDATDARAVVVRCGKELGLVSSELVEALGVSPATVSRHWTRRPTDQQRVVIERCLTRMTRATRKSVPNPQAARRT